MTVHNAITLYDGSLSRKWDRVIARLRSCMADLGDLEDPAIRVEARQKANGLTG